MLSELELWEQAARLIEQHGSEAAPYAVERVRELVAGGDDAAALFWALIASQVRRLLGPGTGEMH